MPASLYWRQMFYFEETAGNPAQAILNAGDSQGSGIYWIQPPGKTAPAQTYCDMSFSGGAWTLAGYGYVHRSAKGTVDKYDKGIPNVNNPFSHVWLPKQRSTSNGLINLPHRAV